MINKKEEKSISEIESYAITFIGNPIQKLQKLTEQELIKLQLSKHNIETTCSKLDLLIKRCNLEKSYFGHIANWYGALSWWMKIFLFILVGGIGAIIGMLVSMPITIVSVSSFVYIFFAFFFINHYNVTERQITRLCKDTLELEQLLADTIDNFNQLSNKLKDIIKNMHELNQHFLADMQSMHTNVEELTHQLNRYKLIINELQDAQSAMVFSTNQTRSNLDLGCAQYIACCELLVKQAADIDFISTNLGNSDQSLNTDLEQLAALIEKYELHCERIKIAADCAEDFLDNLRKSNIKHEYTEVPASTVSSDPLIIDCAGQTIPTVSSLSIVGNDYLGKDDVYKVLAEARQARENSSNALKKLQCVQMASDSLYPNIL